MMVAIGLADLAYTLQRRLVADMTTERVARICGVDDDRASAQRRDRLTYEAPLRGDRMQLQIDAHALEVMIRAWLNSSNGRH